MKSSNVEYIKTLIVRGRIDNAETNIFILSPEEGRHCIIVVCIYISFTCAKFEIIILSNMEDINDFRI